MSPARCLARCSSRAAAALPQSDSAVCRAWLHGGEQQEQQQPLWQQAAGHGDGSLLLLLSQHPLGWVFFSPHSLVGWVIGGENEVCGGGQG